jgi:hypothetical protein
MTERIESRMERRRRRERRRAGMIGLGVLVSSVGATVTLLLIGPDSAHGAVNHTPPAVKTHAVATTFGAP